MGFDSWVEDCLEVPGPAGQVFQLGLEFVLAVDRLQALLLGPVEVVAFGPRIASKDQVQPQQQLQFF